MPRLTIDQREVEVPPGATILDAARQLGVEIPTLCHLQGHDPNTSCMICVVKVAGKWVPSCATRAEEGMAVENQTEEVRHLRRVGLELLLSDHAMRCRECELGTGCALRRHTREYGARPARFRGARRQVEPETRPGGVLYEPDKCILCGLCVQVVEAAREPLGLSFVGRGFDVQLAVPFGQTMAEGLGQAATRCIEVCPTGALSWNRLNGPPLNMATL